MAERDFWDGFGDLLEKGVTGFFDMRTADSQAEAARALENAEAARLSMIDQLTRNFTLNGSGQLVGATASWVLPLAVLGIGGVLIYKFVK
ncbi:MAG: hypothetical protein DI626_06270 [Micavibrio aeruginosavorus]|uniref:Uncharacterized protein n=1 Tax=Micavibrio aeruginosavorus TaxID=349221 RepID=A0A2W4ZZJ9_9BACT|nr:MAG: hypothetical protein DI626_06270 [Micavibrio aeruginosavorus]